MTDLFNNPVSLVERGPRKGKGNQQTLFKEIRSVSFDQNELLHSIVTLHAPAGFDCDASYGYGEFHTQIHRPTYCFDIDPKKPEATYGDSRALPLASSSIKTLMFDPPFVVTNHKESEEYVMGKKYGAYRSVTELRDHYQRSLDEFARVLKPYGVVVFKCQDFVHGRSQYFIHNEVLEMARRSGFRPVDLFILFAKTRFKGAIQEQNHARKYHSYFWVFKKARKSRSGSGECV